MTPNTPTQKEIIDFIRDPKNISKAVEGSMDKRNAVMNPKPLESKYCKHTWHLLASETRVQYTEPKTYHFTFICDGCGDIKKTRSNKL